LSKNLQLLFILLSFLSFNYELKAQCNNADFELGNFSGWTGGRGTPNGGSGNFPGGCCPIVINNMLNTAALVPPVKVFRVFNRWGEMVFETNDVNKGWDGYFKGQICYPAVYDYYIEGTCSDGNVLVKKGNVTLIR
jgi:hypothetical protein